MKRRGDEGMTLIELMVAIGLSGLVTTLVVTMFVSSSRSFTDQQGATASSRLGSSAMNEVTRIIRAGTEIPVSGSTKNLAVLTYAGAEQLTIHAFIDSESSTDPAPVKVAFNRNANNELVETRYAAKHINGTYWTFETTASYSRIIARSLLPADTKKPLFRYFDDEGDELVPSAGKSLTDDQVRTIASVLVRMTVQANGSGRTQAVELQNQVGLPNLGTSRLENQ